MITFPCDKCDKLLEADDTQANQRLACPYCGDINRVPPAASPSVNHATGGLSARAAAPDRAEQMGLPPDRGPEVQVIKVHPAMFRAKPWLGLILWTLIIGGLITAIAGLATGVGIPFAIGGGIALAIGLIGLGIWWVLSLGTTLTITNKRTIVRRGILSRATREILHDRIQDIQITQSFWNRIWNVGTIGLSSSGEAGIEIHVEGLARPIRLREMIDAYRNV